MRISEFSISFRPHATRGARTIVVMAVAVVMAACGAKSSTPSTQVAAKVGKGEISVHQINFLLRRQGELPAPQQAAAQREVLERLVDQELAVQKAQTLKIDRDPQVMQAIEAARREIIARAYIDRVTSTVTKPTAEELKQYRNSHPLLFAERRLYELQEVNARGGAEALAAVGPKLGAVKSADEAVTLLRAAGLAPEVRQSSLAPENLPQALVERVAKLQPSQPLVLNVNGGVKVVFVASSREAALDENASFPRIEAFLTSERKRQTAEQDLKALRAAETVEYTGPFAGSASAPASGAAAVPAPAPEAKASSNSSGGIDDATVTRGLK
jgi:EpsD family peptidyl-prolyl cis-trans isomerase